ncbi:MAG: 30S ribosomal protein S3 [Chloroflexi bacterium]|nr:30S ribosomal protein S3 [Chloroflexota bacterium]
MGQKVHPLGFRLGISKEWQGRWFAERDYPALVAEDMNIRKAITKNYTDANITMVNIERGPHEVSVTMFTAKPGLVIGRGGQRVDESRSQLEAITGKRVRLNVQEVREPELDAHVVASSIAGQLERRVAFRRAIKQAATRAMQRGAQGVKIVCGGRLGGSELARRTMERVGRMPLHTLRADVDYGFTEARTMQGRIGIKVWIYKGDILPEGVSEERMKAVEALASPQSPALQTKEEASPRAQKEASATTDES